MQAFVSVADQRYKGHYLQSAPVDVVQEEKTKHYSQILNEKMPPCLQKIVTRSLSDILILQFLNI